MSEMLKFDILNHISNEDFASTSRSLIADCEDIERKFLGGEYEECCVKVREESENILRYIFGRLVRIPSDRDTAGRILYNNEFNEKVDDVALKMSAQSVQTIGSRYAHKKQRDGETEEQYKFRMQQDKEAAQYNAEEIIKKFNVVLERGITYINDRIPGVRGNLQIEFQSRINEKTGKTEKVLVANLSDVIDRKAYTYVWRIKGVEGVYKERTYWILLNQDWMKGSTIVLEATKDGLKTPVLTAEYGPIKEEEILLDKRIRSSNSNVSESKTDSSRPKGKIIVEIDESFPKSGVKLQARLVDADYKIEDEDISVEWGFIGNDKKFHPITKGKKSTVFICDDPKKSMGKHFTFSIRRRGFANPLQGSFRKLTEADFESKEITKVPIPDADDKSSIDEKKSMSKVPKDYSLSLSIKEHEGNRAIWATITPGDMDVKSLEFNWTVENRDGKKVTKKYKGVHLEAKDIKNEERVTCTVTLPNATEPLYAEIVCGKGQTSQKNNSEELEKKDKEQKVQEIEVKEDDNKQELNITEREPAVVPMEELASEPVIFDALNGLDHYFVCPADFFALNDFEIVDRDTYLYRLLKNDGYENVYYFDNDRGWKVKAFDDASLQFLFSSGKDVKKTASILKTPLLKSKKEESSKEKNSRNDWIDVSTAQTFRGFVHNEFSNILSGKERKSAFVIPIDLFLLPDYFGSAGNTQIIKSLQGNHYKKNENIIVISLYKRDDLIWCVTQGQTSVHGFSSTVENAVRDNITVDVANVSYEELKSKNQIHMANRYGTDEIANVLFRHILFGENKVLQNIKPNKIYGLAEKLREFYEPDEYKKNRDSRNLFSTLTSKPEGVIRGLDAELSHNDVAEELLEVSKKVRDFGIRFSTKLNPLSVERVHPDVPKRYYYDPEKEVEQEFDRYIGTEMERLKSDLLKKIDSLVLKKKREGIVQQTDMSFSFVGAPGTGKTSIARLLGKLMYAKGLLPTDKFVEVNATLLVDSHPGAVKDALMREAENASGGILFIDEFYALNNPVQGGNIGNEGINALMAILDDNSYNECVVIAGYENEVNKVVEFNQGGKRRFKNKMKFEAYSVQTLIQIFHSLISARGLDLEPGMDQALIRLFETELSINVNEDGESTFGNAGYVEKLVDDVLAEYEERRDEDQVVKIEDLLNACPEKRVFLTNSDVDEESILKEFDNMIGEEMIAVKEQIKAITVRYKREEDRARKNDKKRKNLVMQFVGPPGTGKTTVADILGRYLCVQGLVPTQNVHKIVAGKFLKGHLGDFNTAFETEARKARGGVLFIDEFYQINKPYSTDGGGSGNTAQEAIDALMRIADDENSKICIIIAGYKKKMEEVLLFNEGAASRFNENVVEFPVYSTNTLMEIYRNKMEEKELTYDEEVEQLVREILTQEIDKYKKGKNEGFGNARFVENELISKLEGQCIKRDINETHITPQDVRDAFPMLNSRGKDFSKGKKYKQIAKSRLIEAMKESEEIYPTREYTEIELPTYTEKSVLFIEARTDDVVKYGTAFIIHKRGYAITCAHVIRDANEITARLYVEENVGKKNMTFQCSVLNMDLEFDMALLQVEGGEGLSYIRLAEEGRKIIRNERFMLDGYPMGARLASDHTTYLGTVASSERQVDNNGNERRIIQGEAKSGNSGGPLISLTDGSVIGILQGAIYDKTSGDYVEEANFMRPIRFFWSAFTI